MTLRRLSVAPVLEHELGPDGLLVVRLRNEDLRIQTVPGTGVRISGPDRGAIADIEVVRGPRSLEVRSTGGSGDDLLIEVPGTTNLLVEASSSDVEVEGVVGDQRYRTASGDITLRDVAGTIAVEAMSGDVEVTVLGPARLDVRSVSGDVELRAETIATLRVATTSGDLAIAGRFDGEGPFAIETVSGDVTLAPTDDVRVDIRTITGDVRSALAARLEEETGQRVLVVGTGGPTIAFRSTSGDLRVVDAMRRPARPAPVDVAPPVEPTGDADPESDADGLTVLRALERGDIDVDEARRRLEMLDRGEPLHPSDPAPAAAGVDEETGDA